ncbi:uncharacterized protein LOC125656364 [Ostrea edulis]|uniref:uncharacterized protein LOC125656364 n=1 Tax=Ostrea edulis TaxID=37623 RepID=UPI0024AEC2B4|nr:uncharacterized protein LOC125656364 [Ostrea edulis]
MIATSGEPSGLAVMKDGSVIYSVCGDRAIYQVFPNKQTIKLVNTTGQPIGLCCISSGGILFCVYGCKIHYLGVIFGSVATVTIVRYSSSGEKIQEFKICREHCECQRHCKILEEEWPICENVNGDLCIGHRYKHAIDKVVVCSKSGNARFDYNGLGGTQKFDWFKVHGLATDSLGHILISDGFNHVVHLISQNGDFIAYILTQNDRISCPSGISVDQSDNLWLVESGSVKVYQYMS